MSFDFDLFVIGAGSGGVRAARFAAGFGARVAVAESRYLGGTCVNVGCVPKKLLVYGAHFSEDFEQARAYGWSAGEAQFDWATLIGNKNREIQRLNGIYRNLLVNSGVTLLEGHARLLDAHSVEVDGQRFSAKHILIATGGWPQVPDIPGKEHAITSNEAFFLERLPRRVLVVGGGEVALRKARLLADAGARLRVVAPQIHIELRHLVEQGGGELLERDYQDGDQPGCALIIAATDDEPLNAEVSRAANARGIPVNVVDAPALCSVIFPAIV
ncbi:MAG: FAD-dependent oxidoreductase, partial [Pseudomonas aeruginosa]|nr:FAD-dependent oxidoreductase [Pseudomonas aeruginosa]